ncbi:hypothetical protein K439DRAFT_411864 [Ramaria rubella]|nr:hypothetical protein K439DRAFT_411864 [Ramaria rubella]
MKVKHISGFKWHLCTTRVLFHTNGCTQCTMIWPWSGEGKQLQWIYPIKWLRNLHSPIALLT